MAATLGPALGRSPAEPGAKGGYGAFTWGIVGCDDVAVAGSNTLLEGATGEEIIGVDPVAYPPAKLFFISLFSSRCSFS